MAIVNDVYYHPALQTVDLQVTSIVAKIMFIGGPKGQLSTDDAFLLVILNPCLDQKGFLFRQPGSYNSCFRSKFLS